MGGSGQLRRVPQSNVKITFDPFAKLKTAVPHEVEDKNYRQAFTLYCASCMEAYGLQSGKLANRRVGECGICGKDGFLVGNMGAETDEIAIAQVANVRGNRTPDLTLNGWPDNS